MKYIKKFENHAAYEVAESGLILPNVSLCVQEDEVHYKPIDPCASEKVQTTYEWVEIGGVKWATKNVGALTETDYGQYFSWGGVNGYTNDQVSDRCHAFSWDNYEHGTSSSNLTKYNSTDSLVTLETSDDAATVNMGSGWRMPTMEEFKKLTAATTSERVANYQGSGVNGRLFTGKANTADAGKTLFFPAAGRCIGNTVDISYYYGYYWSSSLSTTNKDLGSYLYFDASDCRINTLSRNDGFPVRGVMD